MRRELPMNRLSLLAVAFVAAARVVSHAAEPATEPVTTLVSDLKNPESVAVDAKGRVFISIIGDFDVKGTARSRFSMMARPRPLPAAWMIPRGSWPSMGCCSWRI
jgi:hypothetical protein